MENAVSNFEMNFDLKPLELAPAKLISWYLHSYLHSWLYIPGITPARRPYVNKKKAEARHGHHPSRPPRPHFAQ